MAPLKLEDFNIESHKSMIENMNRISDDLVKVKYYFLAAIAIAGLGYKYILIDYQNTSNKNYYLFIICIFANTIYWLISEYALSHGFLFRFIQTKAAKIEKYFYQNNQFRRIIKDPTDEEEFFEKIKEKEHLKIDFIIPDQFVPLYWISIWAIVINSIFISYIISSRCWINIFSEGLSLIIISISLVLLWKLLYYHIYKIENFIEGCCDFKIITKNKKSIFKLPSLDRSWTIPIIIALFIGVCIFIIYFKEYNIYAIFLIIFLWFPIFALIIHFIGFILKIIIPDFIKGKAPEIINRYYCSGKTKIEVDIKSEIYRYFWLLITIT